MNDAQGNRSTGIQRNLGGLLCYVAGWVTGIVFLLIEKENRFIRFHAVQSIVTFGAITIVQIIVFFIPLIGWILDFIILAMAVILWIVCMLRAFDGQMFKLPIVGDFADRHSKPSTR